ncbi:ABC transporter substrate-binding protein [Microbacterium sp. No. 7]|uniref:ABC transporter substrate-binding protein n=1 Tax=Microbacterium sp. No. 7 TaxID=1714373 RepID=UPI0006D1C761|nr:ABC transporter substrate-binding protein [Microbacterium sp. No. 7]ALJ20070.1 hypothetical protein AOA12_09170 [Microbacterium sp. No. 7]
MKLPRSLAAVVAVSALLFAGCAGGGDGGGGDGGSGSTGGDGASSNAVTVLSIAQHAGPPSLDPEQALAGEQHFVFQTTYDSLILLTPDGQFEPMLATSWEFSDDLKTLSMELRDDVSFTDGAKFDAEAVKANILHYRDGTGATAGNLRLVQDVVVTGEYSVDIVLSDVEPYLLMYLANGSGFMGSPEKLGTEEIKTNPVGTGPYIYDATASSVGENLWFTKNPDYWNPDLQHFEKVNLQIIGDQTARVNALVSGQIDAVNVDLSSADQVEGAGMIYVGTENAGYGLHLTDRNGTKSAAIADVRVRQALNYAFDREKIAASLFNGRAAMNTQLYAPGVDGYLEELEELYPYDPAKGKELVSEAGFEGAEVGVTWLTYTDPAVKAVIQEAFTSIGLVPVVNELVASDAFGLIRPDMPTVLWSAGNRPDPWNGAMSAAPTQPFNTFKIEDPEANRIIADMRANFLDEEKLKAGAEELNRFVMEQAWIVPIYAQPYGYYHSPRLEVDAQYAASIPFLYNFRPAS